MDEEVFQFVIFKWNEDACIFFGKFKVVHYLFIFFMYTQIGCGGKGGLGVDQ
jgi:hypothetical protein